MTAIERLELLVESINSELDDLQSFLERSEDYTLKSKRLKFEKELSDIIRNLESYKDGVYCVFEDAKEDMGYAKDLRYKYEVLWMICDEKLTYDEKLDLKLKFKIDEF